MHCGVILTKQVRFITWVSSLKIHFGIDPYRILYDCGFDYRASCKGRSSWMMSSVTVSCDYRAPADWDPMKGVTVSCDYRAPADWDPMKGVTSSLVTTGPRPTGTR